MCGLVGIFKPSKLSLDEQKFFKNMLYADALRGHHSTGVFTLEAKTAVAADQKFSGYVAKMPGTAINCLTETKSPIAAIVNGKSGLLLGHNRYATMGAHTAANAHPFEHGQVALAHNGTLWDHSNIDPELEFTVDSEAVCHAMSQVDADKSGDVIKKLRGAFALTWFDYRDSTLNLVRNDERPLYIARNGKTIAWASEKLMLEWCADRNGVTFEEVFELPVGQQFKYKLFGFDPANPVITPVELNKEVDPYTRYYGRGSTGYSYGNYTGGSSRGNVTPYKPRKSKAEDEAEEAGFSEGQIVRAWMYDFNGRRWEGMTDCENALTLTCWSAGTATFSGAAEGEYVKLKNFYHLQGKDGKMYLCASVEPESFTKEEFLAQGHTAERVTLLDGTILDKDEYMTQAAFGCVLCDGYIGEDDAHKCVSNVTETGLFCPSCSGPYMEH